MAFSPLSLISPSLAPTACGAKPNLGFFLDALWPPKIFAPEIRKSAGGSLLGPPDGVGTKCGLKVLPRTTTQVLVDNHLLLTGKKGTPRKISDNTKKKLSRQSHGGGWFRIFLFDWMIFGFHFQFPGCNTELFTISGSFFQKDQPRKCLFSNCGFDWNSLEAEPVYIDMKHAKYLESHFWAHGRSSPAPDHTKRPYLPMPLLDQKNISIKGMLKNIPSLKLTYPLKIQLPERKGSYSNLPFSAALAASFRGTHFFTVMCPTHLNRYLLVCCTGITSDGWKPNITTFSVQKKPQTMP